MTLQLANFVYILLMPLAGVRPDCTLSCPSWKRALLVSRIENRRSGERNQKYLES